MKAWSGLQRFVLFLLEDIYQVIALERKGGIGNSRSDKMPESGKRRATLDEAFSRSR